MEVCLIDSLRGMKLAVTAVPRADGVLGTVTLLFSFKSELYFVDSEKINNVYNLRTVN